METFSERDLFELSKAFPGAYTPRVAFANNTITGPVATVRTGFSQSTAANFNKAGVPMEPMGTEDYLVIMYCPYLSQFFMATTETSSVAGSQLSGLFMWQLAPLSSIYSSYLLGAYGTAEPYQACSGPFSANAVFGSTCTIDQKFLPYAAHFNVKLLIPAAWKTSGYFKGRFPLSAFGGDSPDDVTAARISVSSLIQMAEYLGDIDNINFSNSIYLDRNFDHSLSRAYPLNNNSFFNTQEMVEYVVIPKPAISIAGTAVSSNLQYSAIMDITYHTIVNVSARQPFLYKILTPKGVYYHKALLTDVPLIGFKHFDPPKNVHELERILEHTPYFDLINDYNEHDMEVRPDKGLLSELKEVDSDYDLKSEKASEGLKICSIFSKEWDQEMAQIVVWEYMAKYKIQVNKTLQARIPGPGLKDIVFRVMMEPDGKGIIADYKKNPVTKAKQKKERVDTVIKKLGKPANTREEKKAVRKEAIEEIKKEEEQNQEARKLYLKSLDEFIHNLGIELDLTRTAAFNKENLTRQLHDKEFAKITGQKLVNMVYNRLDKLYKKSKRQENAKENN